jgi:drug/metabolite transporter (DMT)-like permease
LQIGDVSVATPVLGLKVVLVAFFITLVLAQTIPPPLWIAAALSTAGIVLLNFTRSANHHRVGLTIAMAASAAAAYALFDVLVQKWSPAWGMGRFLPVMMGFVALYSVIFRICLRDAVGKQGVASPWLYGGAVCFAVQSVMFVSTIAMFGKAAVANVLYSSRGLWSVLAVWLVGHWFQSREQHLGRRVLMARLCGAGLLMTAIVLVVLKR